MDEIDLIILHSLRQIDCDIDDRLSSLSEFTPEMLFETAVKCLRLIKPDLVLPNHLPTGMAQRYSVTAKIAEACTTLGFNGEIGYQTFLYSNVIEVRRVFMFLIERLPKESEKNITTIGLPISKINRLEQTIAQNLQLQLQTAWIPQYCKQNGIVRLAGGLGGDDNNIIMQGSTHDFHPQKLNIPQVLIKSTMINQQSNELLREYWQKRSPTVFQQTKSNTLCSSIIQKNDIDRLNDDLNINYNNNDVEHHGVNNEDQKAVSNSKSNINNNNNNNNNNKKQQILKKNNNNFKELVKISNNKKILASEHQTTVGGGGCGGGVASSINKSIKIMDVKKTTDFRQAKSLQQLTLNSIEIPNQNDIVQLPELSRVDAVTFECEKLKQTIEKCIENRQLLMTKMNDYEQNKIIEEAQILKLKDEKKIKERTHLLLENPQANIVKMGQVLATTEARIKKLSIQWEQHRLPLEEQLERAKESLSEQNSKTGHIREQIKSTKLKTMEIIDDLKSKNTIYAQLANEFEKHNKNINRNDYTSRILEIIANIRKQKMDIDKVLHDTRLLQKEINNITGQLDRQFTITDDLLFKTAKRDEHTKKAYKFLATLHADCNDLITVIQETGQIQREVRDLEEQIDTENNRKIGENLERILIDINLVETEANEILKRLQK